MLRGSLPSVFVDTDVAFDILSKRQPHFTDSLEVFKLVSEGKISALISESAIANLIYLTIDIHKIENGISKLTDFVASCEVIHGGKNAILNAMNSDFKDKEDAVQYFTASVNDADFFVTRNIKDYKAADSSLRPQTPKGFLKELEK